MKIVPTRKVASGVIAGALVTIGVGYLRRAFGIELTGEEGAAYGLVLTFVVQWSIPEKYHADDE
jgi:hypothetical protein